MLMPLTLMSQDINKVNNDYNLYCNKTLDEITIDGILDEETWQKADVADDFHMMMPMDTSLANAITEVRVAYDDKNLHQNNTAVRLVLQSSYQHDRFYLNPL